ncbi:hypothetical protein [Parasedimentitalea psychrophila]|uniref:Uncharacterized protein n=1 Tax=Parasedimentitalea psychrophila TaxID=2997337 RepID=A0A9Y2P559_9RHOB|nr:hypothetical protein [Parasedimentitalea psychrophila]WIY23643.1 hypothetical protein QPJ95_13395 [Parasedimentitalea psychrophila]
MDTQAVIDLGAASAGHVQTQIFAARVLKGTVPIPKNHQDDSF